MVADLELGAAPRSGRLPPDRSGMSGGGHSNGSPASRVLATVAHPETSRHDVAFGASQPRRGLLFGAHVLLATICPDRRLGRGVVGLLGVGLYAPNRRSGGAGRREYAAVVGDVLGWSRSSTPTGCSRLLS